MEKIIGKISVKRVSYRTVLISGFSLAVLVGFGIPYFSFGAGNVASAVSNVSGTASPAQTAAITTLAGEQAVAASASTAATYAYAQMSLHDAYPYYAAAAFMTAGGSLLYALSYVPVRVADRSRYVSRFTTVSRTTY